MKMYEKQEWAASRKSQEGDGSMVSPEHEQVGRFWFKASLPWLSLGRRAFYEERKRMKKTLAGSFMALLLVAFLTACSGTTPGGGGGGGGGAKGPAAVDLKTAGNYVILAESAISDVPTSAVTGDIGISAGLAAAITGFTVTYVGGATSATATEVVGKVYAADYGVPTPANLTAAVAAKLAAYNDAKNRVTPDFSELGAGEIGGKTLVPGLYKWTSAVTISTDVTLSGGANDTWIFQTTGVLTQASAKKVILTGGAQAKNIVWQVAGGVTLGTTAQFSGIILSGTDITLDAGATVTGRLLATTAVHLISSTVTQP